MATSITATTISTSTSSYIDIQKLTSQTFSAQDYANSLVLSTNNPSDPSIDLATPLSRVLFDLQEIDSNIHSLTSRSALDIISYTASHNAAAERIVQRIEEERGRIHQNYQRLETEVLGQYRRATKARLHAERSHAVLKLGRNVQRLVNLARQFEAAISDAGLNDTAAKEDHRALLRATHVVLASRDLFADAEADNTSSGSGGSGGDGLSKINIVKTIRGRVLEDGEAKVLDWARKVVREFSVSSLSSSSSLSGGTTVLANAGSSFRDLEDARTRFVSAVHVLYLLSPTPRIAGPSTLKMNSTTGTNGRKGLTATPVTATAVDNKNRRMTKDEFEPEYLLRSLQAYLSTAITSSSAGIGRALGQLPMLDRALMEVSARCQSVIAFEVLLRGVKAPHHPLLRKPDSAAPDVARRTKSRPSTSRRGTVKESDEGERRAGKTTDGDDDDNNKNCEGNPDGEDRENSENDEEEEEEEEEAVDGNGTEKESLLDLLLSSLDTSSLPSYFWRSLASSLTSRVQDILNRGGVAARTLKSNRDAVRAEIRDCVLRGSKMPTTLLASNSSSNSMNESGSGGPTVRMRKEELVGNWEREAAVMVGSVITPLGR